MATRSRRTRRLSPHRPCGSFSRFEMLEAREVLAVLTPVDQTAKVSTADDAAIWVNTANPAQSTIIGTDKDSKFGLRVYNLEGTQIQAIELGSVNNVDLRQNFPLDGEEVAIVAATALSGDHLAIYKVDPDTGLLENAAARKLSSNTSVYGITMYHSPETGDFYAFIIGKNGVVEQWRLFDNGSGLIDGTIVRTFDVGKQSEGAVADDETGLLYIGEEKVGIWEYSAEPDGGSTRRSVDVTGRNGHLTADVEGLSIYYAANGEGYLLASSQGSDDFNVYTRDGGNTFIGKFSLAGVQNTDGIDVTNAALGSLYPQGLFVAHDPDDTYKLVPWQTIAASFTTPLLIDPDYVVDGGEPDPEENQPPEVNVGSDRSVVMETELELDATVTDDAFTSDPVTYQWEKVSGPGTADFGTPTAVDTTVEFSAAGEYVLRLTANDGTLSASDTLTVTVISNTVPTTSTFQNGVANYQGNVDTTLNSNKPNANHANDRVLVLDGSPDKAAVMRWDVSSIATGAVVQSATIQVVVTDKAAATYDVYIVDRIWDEATATWTRATGSTNWQTPGAQGVDDRGVSIGTLNTSAKGVATITLNSAGVDALQQWIDDPASNFGVTFANFSTSKKAEIASSETANANNRPKLTIVYGPESAPPVTASTLADAAFADSSLAVAAALESSEAAKSPRRFRGVS